MQTNLSSSTDLQTVSREVFWQKHVSLWQESGLSKIAYARQYSLVYSQMVYWCTKLEKAPDDKSKPSKDFVTVSVTPGISDASLCVHLPNGIVIEGINECSVALIGKLVEQL